MQQQATFYTSAAGSTCRKARTGEVPRWLASKAYGTGQHRVPLVITPLIRTNCLNSHPHQWCRHNRACACSSCQRNVRQTSKECRLERIIPFHHHPNNSSHWACNYAERHKSDSQLNAAQQAASRLTAADHLSFAGMGPACSPTTAAMQTIADQHHCVPALPPGTLAGHQCRQNNSQPWYAMLAPAIPRQPRLQRLLGSFRAHAGQRAPVWPQPVHRRGAPHDAAKARHEQRKVVAQPRHPAVNPRP